MSSRFRIGIDLGGTKIEGAALEVSGSVRVRRRVATPVDDYGATIGAIIALVGAIEQEIGQTAPVGIGIPGALSPATGLVKNANSTWLIGRPLQRDLEAALGRPTRLANDANCFALSEATDGAGAAMESVFGVILGQASAADLPFAGGSWSAPTRLPASGDTTRCPGQRRTNVRGQPAIAAGKAVSRPFCPAPPWLRTIFARPARESLHHRSPALLKPATRLAVRLLNAICTGSRAGSPW
jgi:fructokinase